MPFIAGKDAGTEIRANIWLRGRKMTFTRKLTSTLTALAIATASFAPLATTANAGPRGHGHGYGNHYNHGYHGGYRGGRDRYYARHHRKNNTGKYVAIGAAALMLGIIASEAGRR